MVDRPIFYSGQGLSLKGDKERFLLPPAFRKAVIESSAGKAMFYVAKHHTFDCLIGFGQSRHDALMDEIDRDYDRAIAAGASFNRELRMMQAFACHEVNFDPSGRHVLPRHLLKLVSVEDAIFFQGAGPVFTMWAPAVLMAQDGPEWAGFKADCEQLLADGGKGRK